MGGRTTKGTSQNNRQTQTQLNAPPPWAVPLYAQGGADARALYASGRGGNVYQGQRVANLSDETRQAVDALRQNAQGFGNAGLTGLMQAPTQAAQNLTTMARGEQVGNNEAFNTSLQGALDGAATTINSRLSGAGRYGSGAHNRVLATELGNIASRANAEQYNRDVDAQLAANAQIDRANQNQLGAAGNFLQQQADAWTQALRGGQVRDNQTQNKLDSEQQKWLETDNREWERLRLLQEAANGLAGDYGTRASQGQNISRKNPGLNETLGTIGRLAGKR